MAQSLQDALEELNAKDPPGLNAPNFLANMRHGCTKARLSGTTGREVATALDLKEVYVPADDGVHALIYREGQCAKCHLLARSHKGRVVIKENRPPMFGRVARD